jgi:hypothetical protein
MRVSIATERAPEQAVNEDFAAATANAVVLLDGAGLLTLDEGVCRHGVAWYVRQLGSTLLAGMLDRPDRGLTGILADSIGHVAASHQATCDLGHAGTPSATVVMLDVYDKVIRYLVLADSVLLINGPEGQQVVTDSREAVIGRRFRGPMDAVPAGTSAHDDARRNYVERLRSFRNRPGGFWVAAADPRAATEAITGSASARSVESAMLLSDGASRLVDRFHLATWQDVSTLVARSGGHALIDAVRRAERSDLRGQRWPRGKVHDDATVVLCDQL